MVLESGKQNDFLLVISYSFIIMSHTHGLVGVFVERSHPT